MNEAFQFVTVVPPQDALHTASGANIDLGVFSTIFADDLRALRVAGDRSGMISTATALANTPMFVDSPDKIDNTYRDFGLAVRALTNQHFFTGATTAFKRMFKTDPAVFVCTDAFMAFHGRVSDSIVAAAIVPTIPPKVRMLLTATARILWLIRRLGAKSALSLRVFEDALLVLPRDIFPLPLVDAPTLR